MSRYSKSPTRSTRPQIVGNCEISQNEKTYITSLVQKLIKPASSKQDGEILQKQLSHELCRHFQKSIGVSVIQADQSYLQNEHQQSRKQASIAIVFNKFLIRIWIREHDIVSQNNRFQREGVMRN